jgi:hypothetical protein
LNSISYKNKYSLAVENRPLLNSARDLKGGERMTCFRFNGVDQSKLFTCCARSDFLLEHSRRFIALARELVIGLDYIENEGSHEGGY